MRRSTTHAPPRGGRLGLVIGLFTWVALSCSQGTEPEITLLLEQATLSLTGVEGGANPSDVTIDVTATGADVTGLDVATTYGGGQTGNWLSAFFSSTSTPTTLTLRANITGMSAGTYDATVRVSAAETDQSVELDVTLTLDPRPPTLSVPDAPVAFTAERGGLDPVPQVVTVENRGSGTLDEISLGAVTFGTGEPNGWLPTPQLSGNTGSPEITLRVVTGPLPVGMYHAQVSVVAANAANSPLQLPVTFAVTAPVPAGLAVVIEPDGAVDGEAFATQPVVRLVGSNGQTVSVAGVEVTAHLEKGPGTLGPAEALEATTDADGVATFTGLTITGGGAHELRFSAPDLESVVTEEVVVAFVRVIGLDTTRVGLSSFERGPDPAPTTVEVFDASGAGLTGLTVGEVVYGDGQPTGWLEPSLDATDAPATLTLAGTTADLDEGTYTAIVTISAPGAATRAVEVTFDVGDGPSLEPSPAAVEFSATGGGPSPAPQILTLSNGGGGVLTSVSVDAIVYGTGLPTGWLTASPDGSTAPVSITIEAATASLEAGVYTATVQISSPVASNSPIAIPVSLEVGAPQVIATDPSAATFLGSIGGAVSPPSRTVEVSNAGTGELSGLALGNVSYGPGATGWLEPPELSRSIAPAAVELSVNAAALPPDIAPGVYTAVVPITSTLSGVAPGQILVELTLAVAEQICLNHAEVVFRSHVAGTDPDPATVTATGCSGGNVPVELNGITYGNGEPTDWLGATLGVGGEIELTAALGSLELGTYNAVVRIISPAANVLPVEIAVRFEVDAAQQQIGAEPESSEFEAVAGGQDPEFAIVSVINASGLGTLDGLSVARIAYSEAADGWLVASLDGLTAPATLTLTPAIAGLVGGVYGAEVVIASAIPGVDSLHYPVTLTLVDPPSIVLTPTRLDFTAVEYRDDPPAQQVAVSNGGDLPLTGLSVDSITGSGGGPAPWLQATLNVVDAPATLNVQPFVELLSPGTYEAAVRVVSSDPDVAPANVTVTLIVSPGDPPSISLSSETAIFSVLEGGPDPLAAVISVTNGGDVPLDGLYLEPVAYGSGPMGWATALLLGGAVPTHVAIDASAAGLDAGTYHATVTVGSTLPGVSSRQIAVTLTVTAPAAPPVLSVSAATANFVATFGNDPPAKLLDVTASDGDATDLTATVFHGEPDTPWLTATVEPTAPATLTLAADVADSELPLGFYTGSVRISSGTVGVQDVWVNVTLVVGFSTSAPRLEISPPSIGMQVSSAETPADQYVSVLSDGPIPIHNLYAGPVTLAGDPEPLDWATAHLSHTSTPALLTIDFVAPPPGPGPFSLSVPVGSSDAGVAPLSLPIYVQTTPPLYPGPGNLSLSRDDFVFSGNSNGLWDGPETILLTNSGASPVDDLAISIDYVYGPGSWLDAQLSGPSLPAQIDVAVDFSDVVLGAFHYAEMKVTGSTTSYTGQPQVVERTIYFTVSFTDAQIEVDPTFVDIQPYPIVGSTTPIDHAEPIRITNLGSYGTASGLTVTKGGASPWLTPTLSSTAAPALLYLSGDPTGLDIGRYTETLAIDFEHNANPVLVDVAFRVFGFELGQSAVSMSAQDGYTPDVDVGIQFEGNDPELGIITYAEGEPAGWLSAQLTCPFFGCSPGQVNVTLHAEPDALVEGAYHATLLVNGTNPGVPSQTMDVTLTVEPPTTPVIAVSTNAVTLIGAAGGASPVPVEVAVTNTGIGTITDLTLGGSSIPPWLTAEFEDGSTPTVLTLTASVAGLAPGNYFTTLYVGGNGASEFQIISVWLEVRAIPLISLSAELVEFGALAGDANPASKTTLVTATSAGGTPAPLTGLAVESISYAPGQPTGWLTYALSSTTAPATLRLQPLTGSLGEGTYEATVAVSSPVAGNSPRTVLVRFEVGPPSLAVSTNAVTLTAHSPQPAYVDVDVTTGGSVVTDLVVGQPVYQSGDGWLTAALVDGASTPSRLRLTASIGTLAAGDYEASVQVSSAMSEDSPQTIVVTFHVRPGIGVGAAGVSFPLFSPPQGTSTLSHAVTITNTGPGSLTGLTASVSGGAPWLQATLDATTAPTTLRLDVTAGTLAPDYRTASVTIASPVAGNSPQTVSVSYYIGTSFSQDVSPLVNDTSPQRCIGCHGGSQAPDLRATPSQGALWSRLVNQPTPCTTEALTYVVPGRPDLSQLLILVGPRVYPSPHPTGYPCNRRFMPTSESYNPVNGAHTTLRSVIEAWIREGAPNN